MFACLLKDQECQYSRILLDKFNRNRLHHRSRNWILSGNANNSCRLDTFRNQKILISSRIFELFSSSFQTEKTLLKKAPLFCLDYFKVNTFFQSEGNLTGNVVHLTKVLYKGILNKVLRTQDWCALDKYRNKFINLMWNTTSRRTNQHFGLDDLPRSTLAILWSRNMCACFQTQWRTNVD